MSTHNVTVYVPLRVSVVNIDADTPEAACGVALKHIELMLPSLQNDHSQHWVTDSAIEEHLRTKFLVDAVPDGEDAEEWFGKEHPEGRHFTTTFDGGIEADEPLPADTRRAILEACRRGYGSDDFQLPAEGDLIDFPDKVRRSGDEGFWVDGSFYVHVEDAELCSERLAPLAGGDGWDGKCGNCADKTEEEGEFDA